MGLKDTKLNTVSSLGDNRTLRKLAVIFFISSVIPISLLYYFNLKSAQVTTITLILMVLGVLAGYISLYFLIAKTRSILEDNRKMMETTIAELKNKNKKLITMDHLKDDFVNYVSHEIRLPLTVIQESIRQVAEGMFGEVNKEQLKYFNMSLRNIHRLKALVDNMLDISKIEKGELELLKKKIDIGEIITEVLSDFSQKIKRKGLEIIVDLPPRSWGVMADKDKITQVLINLVGNAYKCTDRGFIKISVRENGDFIECCIEDSGRGIAAKNLPHLFSKFHQISQREGQQDKGTGLGLFISKHIIELHQGQIYVESNVGKGTKFTFTLPKAMVESNTRGK